MRRLWASGLGLSLCLGALAWSGVALAQDGGKDAGDAGGYDSGTVTPGAIMAYYCGEADLQCVITQPLLWEKKIELPVSQLSFDTGWIPDSFKELQVRFILQIPAETVVKLGGDFTTTWPQPLTIAVPGERYTGLLRFDYGLIWKALGKIDISVAGYDIDWTGDLPYVPQIDFHVLGADAFDPWAFKPNVASASAFTPSVQLFEINLLEYALGIPSEVAEGGVKVKLKGELKAQYWTNQIKVEPKKPPEQVMQVLPIKSENGTTVHGFKGGTYVEYDVHPEGTAHYDGIIHIIPAFYVSVLGQWDFEMPFYDFPFTIPIGDQDFVFDNIRVHVPLPDVPPLAKVFDFGMVDVGTSKKKSITVSNVGEAKARVVPDVETSMTQIFKVLTSSVEMEPTKSGDVQIRFAPKTLGKQQATLTLMTNDPDTPLQTITLTGQAVEPGTAPPDPEDGGMYWPDDSGQGFYVASNEDGGCGCRSTGGTSGVPMWAGLALMGAAVLARRRRAN